MVAPKNPMRRANTSQSGWLIAFVSSILADISQEYPNYSWWSLAYLLCCIIGVTYVVGADAVYTYHVALTGFLAAGLVFTTSSVNSLIYYPAAAKEAAAAGFILLSIDCVRPQAPLPISTLILT
jgi:SHO1 osmosensor